MRTNQKFLLVLVLVVLVTGIVGGAALALARNSASSVPAALEQDNDDAGEDETAATNSEAALSEDEVIAIAEALTGSTAVFVELEKESGIVVYSVELEDGSEVEVDGNSGDILEVEGAGSDSD